MSIYFLVSYWCLNTEKNVVALERHVGNEIYEYLKEHESQTTIWEREKYELNVDLLNDCNIFAQYKKVYASFIIYVIYYIYFLLHTFMF